MVYGERRVKLSPASRLVYFQRVFTKGFLRPSQRMRTSEYADTLFIGNSALGRRNASVSMRARCVSNNSSLAATSSVVPSVPRPDPIRRGRNAMRREAMSRTIARERQCRLRQKRDREAIRVRVESQPTYVRTYKRTPLSTGTSRRELHSEDVPEISIVDAADAVPSTIVFSR